MKKKGILMYKDFMKILDADKVQIMDDAARMIDGYYHFDGIWDMEPCSEYVDNHNLRWDIRYHGDVEWAYMFTRMGFLYKLFLATMLSGDRTYVNHGVKIIKRWYAANKIYFYGKVGKLADKVLKVNHLAHRTLDVAILTVNVTDFILYCADQQLISDTDFNLCREIAISNTKYIFESDNGFKSFSNWGIIENACILYTMYKLHFEINQKEICQRLNKQIYNQILPWGYHIESSPMYLVQIIIHLLMVMQCRKDPFFNLLEKPVRCACRYIASIQMPTGSIPNIGDSDKTNISDIMIVAAEVLNIKDFYEYSTRELDIEFRYKFKLWDNSYWKNYNTQETERNGYTVYPNQIVYRSSDTYMICSNTNKMYSGHKHYDYFSFIYYVKGAELLTDLGRYTYVDCEERAFYVGPYAHNTILADDQVFYKYLNSFDTIQRIECEETKLLSNGVYNTVKMRCQFGYGDAVITRYVTFLKNYGLIITDLIDDKTDRNYIVIFNIGESFNITERPNEIMISNTANTFYYRNDKNVKIHLQPVCCSNRYNEKSLSRQMQIHVKKGLITHSFFYMNNNLDVIYMANAILYTIPDDNVEIMVSMNKK